MTLSLEDRLAINDLLLSYARGIDSRDWELFRTVFTSDCVADYGAIGTWRGVEEIARFMELAHSAAGSTLHRITNITIEATAGGAHARCYVDSIVMGAGDVNGVQAIGDYDDRLVQTGGTWQIARRRFRLVTMQAVTNLSPPRGEQS